MTQVQVFQTEEYAPTDLIIRSMRELLLTKLDGVAQVQQNAVENLIQDLEVGLTVRNIEIWMRNRNLHQPEYQVAQLRKLKEEVSELTSSVLNEECCLDDCGDVMVVAIGAAMRNGNSGREALLQAFNDIKDRKGRMIDGVFVKEQDL